MRLVAKILQPVKDECHWFGISQELLSALVSRLEFAFQMQG